MSEGLTLDKEYLYFIVIPSFDLVDATVHKSMVYLNVSVTSEPAISITRICCISFAFIWLLLIFHLDISL